MKDLQDYAILATDGNIGHVKDFFFDDAAWVIRYLVVDTGSWLSSRKVLISPVAIGTPDWTNRVLPVSITQVQVKNSPDIDTERPVSRQHEMGYLSYYGYQNYWGGDGLWGAVPYPSMMGLGYTDTPEKRDTQDEATKAMARAEAAQHRDEDPHLRSCTEVIGYHIQATDGELGHVQGMLVDDETWAIRYLVVDTSNWWLGHRVLIAPQWIKQVSWSNTTVTIDLDRKQIQDAPQHDPAAGLERTQEASVFQHYGRPGYWAKEDHVLDYSIMKPEGILVLKPHAPLSKEDFAGLSAAVDAYLSDHAKLHGVLIHTKGFPGWENFGGFTSHMHFVRDHHKKVERIAVVTDSHMGDVAESFGKHFVAAEVKHFPFPDDAAALDWLKAA
jgi:hypothetical protein